MDAFWDTPNVGRLGERGCEIMTEKDAGGEGRSRVLATSSLLSSRLLPFRSPVLGLTHAQTHTYSLILRLCHTQATRTEIHLHEAQSYSESYTSTHSHFGPLTLRLIHTQTNPRPVSHTQTHIHTDSLAPKTLAAKSSGKRHTRMGISASGALPISRSTTTLATTTVKHVTITGPRQWRRGR